MIVIRHTCVRCQSLGTYLLIYEHTHHTSVSLSLCMCVCASLPSPLFIFILADVVCSNACHFHIPVVSSPANHRYAVTLTFAEVSALLNAFLVLSITLKLRE